MRSTKWTLRYLIAACVSLACMIAASVAAAATTPPVGAYVRTGAFRYVSAPNLAPPKLTSHGSTKHLAKGYFFLANFKDLGAVQSNGQPAPLTGQGGPIIYDSKLQPVWVHGVPDDSFALNFRVQSYNGKPALSWWQGVLSNVGVAAPGAQVIVVDQHYKTIAKITGQDGWTISVHEAEIVGGTMWVTAYKPMPMNLAPYGGAANGTFLDSAIQRYDVKTGKLLSTWDALQHINPSMSETHAPPLASIPWDAYHVNAVQVLPNGQFLVSMRNTWAGYLVNQDNSIAWTLGGKGSTFKIPADAAFQWQHNIELHSDGTVSLFDNGCCGFGPKGFNPPDGPTRGEIISLNTGNDTVTLLHQYNHQPAVHTASQGNTELLRNGNVLVGFGAQPYFTEFNLAGQQLFDAQLPYPDESYRTYLESWTGKPKYPPAAVAQKSHGRTAVFVSWNGATQVRSWTVLAGHDAKHLTVVAAHKRKKGFETTIRFRGTFGAYKVYALGAKGRIIGRSRVFHISKAKKHHPPSTGFY